MYDKSDPRSNLAAAAKKEPVFTSYAPSSYARFYELETAESSDSARTWYSRGRNAALSYSEAKAGARFEREGQIDEWALILPDKETSVTIVAGDQRSAVSGNSLTFVPPGDSTIIFETAGRMVRLFTAQSKDLADKCSNASVYDETD